MKRRGRLITSLVAFAALLAVGIVEAQTGPSPNQNQRSEPSARGPQSAPGKPRLGVRLLEISPDLRAYFGAPADRGVLVDSVVAASPAAKAGMRAGDLLVVVDGDATANTHDVLSALSDRKKGASVPIEILRDKKPMTVRVTMEQDPEPVAD